MSTIPERNWKVFKKLHQSALEQFCARVLDEARQVAGDSAGNSHQRCLRLFKLIEHRDGEIADAFNNYRRSTAFWQIVKIQRLGVLTDEQLQEFSEETRRSLAVLQGIADS